MKKKVACNFIKKTVQRVSVEKKLDFKDYKWEKTTTVIHGVSLIKEHFSFLIRDTVLTKDSFFYRQKKQ